MSIFTHGPWHPWFAWHPVNTAAYGWRWLRRLDRRRWDADVPGAPHGWQYRPRTARVADTPTPTKETP